MGGGGAIPQMINLRLPSSGPGLNPKDTIYAFIAKNLYYICRCIEKKDTNELKEAGRVWPIFNKQ